MHTTSTVRTEMCIQLVQSKHDNESGDTSISAMIIPYI